MVGRVKEMALIGGRSGKAAGRGRNWMAEPSGWSARFTVMKLIAEAIEMNKGVASWKLGLST
jgi:hypothetical protein